MTCTPFACAAGVAAAIACRTASTSDTGRLSSRSWPVSAFETSSRSPVSCACSRTLRSIDSRPRADVVVQLAGAQQVEPAEHRVERRAQLVGDRREELVLHAAGGFAFAARLLGLAACCSATRRARRSSETSAVSSRPDDEEREVGLGRPHVRRRASGCQAPTSAPIRSRPAPGRCRRTRRSPSPRCQQQEQAAVVDQRPEERSTTNTAPTAASATAKRSGAGWVGNGYASAVDIVNSPAP